MATVNGVLTTGVAGALLALSATTASAQGLFFGTTPEWYVKGFGGASWVQDTDIDWYFEGSKVANGNFEFETGYVFGAALGAVFTPNFTMELEYAHRQADIDTFEIEGFDIPAEDGRSDSFMLNALYVFDGMGATGSLRPFVGGGVGTTEVKLEVEDATLQRDWILAYQVIGGVAYSVTPNWVLTGEVRWFGAEGGRYELPDNSGNFKFDWDTVDLLVGAAYRF